MGPTTPVTPEERLIPDDERMQEHAHLARLPCGATIPLALLTQRAGAATANAGRIHHAQAPVSFWTPLMGMKLLVSWTAKRPIGLESEILAREATRFPC